MELKIVKRRNFPLLKRERITIEAAFFGSPTPKKNLDIKKRLADMLKADENLIAIRHIYNKFGDSKANIIVNLYEDLDTLNMFEKKKELIKKDKKQTATKKAGK